MSNEEIVKKIQTGEWDAAQLMTELWDKNKGFVYREAKRLRGVAEMDDLMQEGFLGMWQAVAHWQQDKEVMFLSYASFWIHQAMRRYVDKNSMVSISSHSLIVRYKRLLSEFEARFGRTPTEKETRQALTLTAAEYERLQLALTKSSTASLDAVVGDGEGCALGDLLPSQTNVEDDVLDRVQAEELSALIWQMVDALPGAAPEIIKAIYRDKQTLECVAASRNCTVSAVRREKDNALSRLRRSRNAWRLRSFLPDDRVYALGMTGTGVSSFRRTWTSATEHTALHLMEYETNVEQRRNEFLYTMCARGMRDAQTWAGTAPATAGRPQNEKDGEMDV